MTLEQFQFLVIHELLHQTVTDVYRNGQKFTVFRTPTKEDVDQVIKRVMAFIESEMNTMRTEGTIK